MSSSLLELTAVLFAVYPAVGSSRTSTNSAYRKCYYNTVVCIVKEVLFAEDAVNATGCLFDSLDESSHKQPAALKICFPYTGNYQRHVEDRSIIRISLNHDINGKYTTCSLMVRTLDAINI